MILDIRHDTLKPGCREAFIAFFEDHNRAALRNDGMLVFGPVRVLETPDKVRWMRPFASMESREALKDAFYDGSVWSEQIEPTAMCMIAHDDAELTETMTEFDGKRR